MRPKFKINNSDSYEYLVHGQDLQIEFRIPYSFFTIVNYKELHTRIWFHKSLTSIYYKAPFLRFYNVLIHHKFPGLKNRKLVSTDFEYPNTSYNYDSNFIPNSFLDNIFKFKSNNGVINTKANYHYPYIYFIGFGLGISFYKKKLNIKLIDLKEEQLTIVNKVVFPSIISEQVKINHITPIINIIPNMISFKKSDLELVKSYSTINYNKTIINQKLNNYTTNNKLTLNNK